MDLKRHIRHPLEYAALRVLAWLLHRLPYRAALALGWAAAWLAFHVAHYRVAEARRRIGEVFPGRFDARGLRRTAWLSWRNFVFTAVEMLRIPVTTSAQLRQVVEIGPGLRRIQESVRGGRGAIIATLHMGSWEMASLSCLDCGLPLFSLAAPQKNRLVDDYLNRARAASGFETLLRTGGVLKAIVRRLRAGKVLAILPDVRAKAPGLSIRFLGKTMNVAGGLGLVARLSGAPVFPCVFTRMGWTRHHYQVFDPLLADPALDKDADIRRLTQAVFEVFERAIREQPEQWFWFNKRWIFDPLPPAPAGAAAAELAP